MPKPRIPIQWIGHSDLQWLASTLHSPAREDLLKDIYRDSPAESGPTSTLLESESFDEVILLSNYKKKWNDQFARAFDGANVTVTKVDLDKPTEYDAIFEIALAQLSELETRLGDRLFELCIHLSPGTPAMTAVWVLLGSTQFQATFFQTHRSRAWKAEIPFDLTLDVIPAYLRDPDSTLHHLASEAPSDVAGFTKLDGI